VLGCHSLPTIPSARSRPRSGPKLSTSAATDAPPAPWLLVSVPVEAGAGVAPVELAVLEKPNREDSGEEEDEDAESLKLRLICMHPGGREKGKQNRVFAEPHKIGRSSNLRPQ